MHASGLRMLPRGFDNKNIGLRYITYVCHFAHIACVILPDRWPKMTHLGHTHSTYIFSSKTAISSRLLQELDEERGALRKNTQLPTQKR